MKMRLYRIPYIDVTSPQVVRLFFEGQVQEGGEGGFSVDFYMYV